MLIKVIGEGIPLDVVPETKANDKRWQASPQARFERLLRENQVPIGLLSNGDLVRLVYSPRGESTGRLTFPVAAMCEVPGRPILAAFHMLLSAERLFVVPSEQRLPALLLKSRKYQNEVSTKLAEQVLRALNELMRGFQSANEGMLGIPGLKLYAPPIDPGDPLAPRTGITAWMFPEWFVAQYEPDPSAKVRSRPLIHRESLVRSKYLALDRKRYPVVPIRFVQACLDGHISDIDWYGFVHGHASTCRRQMFVDERDTGGDLSDITIRCECGQSRPMISAAQISDKALGFCRGHRPWLGPAAAEKCGGDNGKPEINRLLIRSASNAYFPQIVSVISIPDLNEK
jgi:hypothetical protein